MDLTSIRDITTVQTGSGVTIAVTKPSNMATGDLILVWLETYQCTVTAQPTGFSTLLNLTDQGEMDGFVCGKVATGSEPATYDFTVNNAGPGWAAHAALITGSLAKLTNFPTDLIVDSDVASVGSGTSVVVPELTGLPAGALLLGHVASRGSAATITSNGSVMTALWNTDSFSSRSGRSFHQASVTGATGTRTFDSTANTHHTAGLVALAPAPSSTTVGAELESSAPMVVSRSRPTVTVFARSMANAARKAIGDFRPKGGLWLPEAYAR